MRGRDGEGVPDIFAARASPTSIARCSPNESPPREKRSPAGAGRLRIALLEGSTIVVILADGTCNLTTLPRNREMRTLSDSNADTGELHLHRTHRYIPTTPE